MTDYWLIRMHKGTAYIWKRKYFLGLFAIPWYFHGGTNIVRTPTNGRDVLQAAFKYINSQTPEANITVETEKYIYKKVKPGTKV